MNLSILICAVTNRNQNSLYEELNKQCAGKPVEIVSLADNKKRTVGEKRNNLVDLAQGKYLTFIDDDDSVESDYVDLILDKTSSGADCIVFGAKRYVNGTFDKEVKYGIEYKKDYEDANYYYRIPNHLMGFKTEIVKAVPYIHVNFGEDAKWAKDVYRFIKSQSSIDKVLYHYYFNTEKTETQK